MSNVLARRGPAFGFRGAFDRLIQTWVWGMDIHPSARIEPSALIDRTWPKGVHIGEHSYIAQEVVVLTHDITRNLFLDTRIGARCHLGARSIILPGVTIGDDCFIEPGALVNRDVPQNSIAKGNPAQITER